MLSYRALADVRQSVILSPAVLVLWLSSHSIGRYASCGVLSTLHGITGKVASQAKKSHQDLEIEPANVCLYVGLSALYMIMHSAGLAQELTTTIGTVDLSHCF